MQQASKDGAGNLGGKGTTDEGCPARRPLLPPPTPTSCLAHLILSLVYANQEEQLSQEEVDAQVLVDGIAVGLQPPQEAEGGDADGQADQRDHDAHPGDD